MKLQDIIQSPQIKIYDISDFTNKNYHKREIIHKARHEKIVGLAKEIGIFDLFRRQLPLQNSRSLWFFKQLYEFTKKQDDLDLYEYHVNNFEWDKSDERYSSYTNYWLVLCEETRNSEYFDRVRKDIDESSSYIPSPETIIEKVVSNRRSNITDNILFKASKRKIEKTIRNALLEPSVKEIEEVVNRLCSFKLSKAFENAAKLYSISEEIEDLSRAVDVYNNYFQCENGRQYSSFFFNAKRGLEILLKTSRRNAVREEYKTKVLEKAKEDWWVGTAFSNLKDLFLMTRLPEDKDNVDKLIDRGIILLRKGVSTNFSNYTSELFDVYKATGDRSYLDKYESMTVSRNGKKRHPAFMGEKPLITLPIFEVTGDTKYIPEIEAYCKSVIEKKEYRTAENIYLRMFELTGNQQYYDKAREMLEITKEEVSEEKLILGPADIFRAIDKTLNARGKTEEILTGNSYDQTSMMPSLGEMNEFEVLIRINSDIHRLVKYASKNPNPADIDDLRKNISLLGEMSNSYYMNLSYLFDLYQITGDKGDLDNIGERFKSYALEEHDLIEDKNLLEEITYKKDF